MLGISCILVTAEEPVFISVRSSEPLNEAELSVLGIKILFCYGDYNSWVFIVILKIVFLSYLDKDGSVQPVPFKQEGRHYCSNSQQHY